MGNKHVPDELKQPKSIIIVGGVFVALFIIGIIADVFGAIDGVRNIFQNDVPTLVAVITEIPPLTPLSGQTEQPAHFSTNTPTIGSTSQPDLPLETLELQTNTPTTPNHTPTHVLTPIPPTDTPINPLPTTINLDFGYIDQFDQEEFTSPTGGNLFESGTWVLDNGFLKAQEDNSLLLIGSPTWDNYALEFSVSYSSSLQSPHVIHIGYIDKNHTLNFAIWSDYMLDWGYCNDTCEFIDGKSLDLRSVEGFSPNHKHSAQPVLIRIEVSHGLIKVFYNTILVYEFDSPIATNGYVGISGNSQFPTGIDYVTVIPLD